MTIRSRFTKINYYPRKHPLLFHLNARVLIHYLDFSQIHDYTDILKSQ